jgi:hypothetical protein
MDDVVSIPFPFESAGPAIRLIVLVMMIVMAFLLLGVIAYLVGLPGRIATSRAHP